MELRLNLLGIKRSIDLSRYARYRNAAVVLVSALLVIPLTVWLLQPAAVPDLAHGNVAGAKAMTDGWAKGDMIVLVRHVERCDHSSAPCLAGDDGITERSRSVAAGVGEQFQRLGMSKADVYNSPILRTVQTANFMFSKAAVGEDWLISCKGTMLRDALAHKVAGRNLVLVTHSECMAQLEKDLKLPTATLGYGASLFISAPTPQTTHMLGFIEASDWHTVTTE
ncbi:histidine phosphatase family protein [Pseudomonas arsenicoxydans]|uniref:Histidine phosphatase family protein n=1 Tax=Pseudomonas arsenicoxydans TaxID=702115 RepID=A0A502I6S7_9PSED|nr:histidine phosphatase family protein [Pseudomonas arsenicoxydans]TPG81356.1 histidine phosphatase family protein [Pseudomonas arsenicoxydans]